MEGRPVKRRGRPNRGGGRFTRGRGQRGRGGRGRGQQASPRGGSRGGGSGFTRKGLDDKYDWEDHPLDGLPLDDDDYDRGYTAPKRRHNGPQVKVTMQHLQMSTENQEMVRDMLRDLHGEELDMPEQDEYDELDTRDNHHYWITQQPLQIEDGCSFAFYGHAEDVGETPKRAKAPKTINQFGIQKLARYGFDKERCIEALKACDEDIGASLERLLCESFNLLKVDVPQDGEQTSEEWQEILDARMEEMTALQSIYDDKFEERIANKIWILHLDLESLNQILHPTPSKPRQMVKRQYDKNICKYFQKGSCKFGSKCRHKHSVLNPDEDSVEEQHTKMNSSYQLEVRFPPGNKYPREPPFLVFSSSHPFLPTHSCLHITRFLIEEAKSLSEHHEPVIFTLLSLLEDDGVLQSLVEQPPLEFSVPKAIISRNQFRILEEGNFGASADQGVDDDEEDDDEQVAKMVEMMEKEGEKNAVVEEVIPTQKYGRKDVVPRRINKTELFKKNRLMKDDFEKKQSSGSYKNMIAQRGKLPAWDRQDEIVETIESNQVVVISGMTGCGKTTQVPQFILDKYLRSKSMKMCNIICTQPRRISAISVAERVADERCEKLGRSVGYQIRLESKQSAWTRLLFCTTGIILRQLEGDPSLEGVTHLIIDEVHERSEDSDFLIMILRNLLRVRHDLKVILMSATLNADLFSHYFKECPVLEIPGRTFPVDQFFLEDAIEYTRFVMEENSAYARPIKRSNAMRAQPGRGQGRISADDIHDELEEIGNTVMVEPAKDNIRDDNLSVKQLFYRYSEYHKSTIKAMAIMDMEKINFDLIVAILEWIVGGKHEYRKDGAILIFMPGFAEIQTLYDMLMTSKEFGSRNRGRYKIVPLHSSLSSEDQHAVFSRPREGVTKIVISTNIAETSITIDDVVFVIDAGRMKEKRYDSCKGMESLEMVWVSRANAQQRKGRAGRVASGVCFHLFTQHRFEHHLRPQPIPEIQRAPLEQIVLRIKMLPLFKKHGIQEVLESLLEPPKGDAIHNAIKRLQDLGALDDLQELTPLGYHVGSLPVDVRIGKLMLLGAIFRCLDAALTIAATLSSKSPFVSPFDKRDEADKKKLEFAVGNSDHLTMLKAYMGWIEAKEKGSHNQYVFCRENFLSIKSLQMLCSLKQQFVELLSDIGFVKEGVTLRDVERAARTGGRDGVLEATGQEANVNSKNWKLVSAVLVGALYPNVVQILVPETRYSQSSGGAIMKAPRPEEMKFKTKMDGYVSVHPSSVNFQVRHYDSPYLVYHEKVKTSKVYIRDCTMVSVYPLLLFGGGTLSVELSKGSFILSVDDGWIRFMAGSHQIAELVKELKNELDQLLADKIKMPHMDLCTCPRGSTIIATIVKLITTQ
ncbi:putative ATP-dependent RNA helicase DHX57 [Haliotis rufescens]|uniref:putative ATP-dependent RNA helicase DHX57 n=1 Tax=Haliotis rufescens TaxID=6454 RepID=UPI00201F6646|nr:putative ATP-dependent RNA helicase DHX57 [Haliotis rufescens]XP_046351216.2 putative ATP-dependent RNA helicase DHX57 [Haliotis rufescens]